MLSSSSTVQQIESESTKQTNKIDSNRIQYSSSGLQAVLGRRLARHLARHLSEEYRPMRYSVNSPQQCRLKHRIHPKQHTQRNGLDNL